MKRGWQTSAPRTNNTARLPPELLEQIGISTSAGGAASDQRPTLSRKDQRKQQRQQKKDNRQQHQKQRGGRDEEKAKKAAPPSAPASRPPAAKPAPPPPPAAAEQPVAKAAKKSKSQKKRAREREPTALEVLLQERGLIKGRDGSGPRDMIDDRIGELERKLGLHKGSKGKLAKARLQKELDVDGLGDIAAVSKGQISEGSLDALTALDELEAAGMDEEDEEDDGDGSEDESSSDVDGGAGVVDDDMDDESDEEEAESDGEEAESEEEELDEGVEEEEEEDDEEDDEEEEGDSDLDDDDARIAELERKLGSDAEESSDDEEDDDAYDEEGEEEDEEEDDEEPPPPKRSKGAEPSAPVAAPSAGKYIPPAARRAAAEAAAAAGAPAEAAAPPSGARGILEAASSVDATSHRRVRGLLNKLTEQNVNGVSMEMAELLGESRALSAAFTKALLSSCLSRTQLLAPLVLLSAVLVRALSMRLGQNLLTIVVEALVVAFEEARERAAERDEASEHECCNAALMLAHLYNLGAVHASLLYELLRRLIASSREAELQMLIVILRAVGPQLRSDDPTALKEIVLDVQSRTGVGGGGGGGEEPSARARVFLSMLMDLKNNKQKKAEAAAAADGALGRLRKWLKTLASSGGGVHEPAAFKVGWEELLQASSRGRWWVIGSAWAGRAAGASAAGGGGSSSGRGSADGGRAGDGGERARAAGDERLLKLAESQRMNTDLRRKIFVAIMGADDYVDAHTRVSALRLAKGQHAEITRVVLDCCGQEGVFNRFYALLFARLCESHREVRFSCQFAFWDIFKQLAELSLHRTANLARLLANLVLKGAAAISTLKVVNWSGPSPRMVFYWQVFFVELLTEGSKGERRKACAPLHEAGSKELREGVLLFLERHLKKMVAKQHPHLAAAYKGLVAYVEEGGGGGDRAPGDDEPRVGARVWKQMR